MYPPEKQIYNLFLTPHLTGNTLLKYPIIKNLLILLLIIETVKQKTYGLYSKYARDCAGLSQAQRAASALQSAVDSSRRTGSLGSTGLPAAGSRGPLSATLASRGAKPQQLLRQTAGPHPGQAGRLGNGSGAHQGEHPPPVNP